MTRALARAAHYLTRLRSIAQVEGLALLGYGGARDIHLDADVRLPNPGRVMMGSRVRLCRGVKLECLALDGRAEAGQILIGDRVFVGERVTIVSHESIAIGVSTMIAPNCSIMDFNHGTALGMPMAEQLGRTAAVSIGADCWIGTGVVVLPGVTIGSGTVVGAGSVVARSLPENVIAVGVPARVVRAR